MSKGDERDLQTEVIETIRELAAKKGYSINRLADFSGLSRGYVSKMMRGQQSPTLRTLEKLALALDADIQVSFTPTRRSD